MLLCTHPHIVALLSFSTGLIYGILMSIARILQGGHFLSDTIWSLGVVLSTIIVLYYFIFQPPIKEKKQALFLTKKQKLNTFKMFDPLRCNNSKK